MCVCVWGRVGVCVFVCETIAKPSSGLAFKISWAHLGESIHAVIKCFESMFWIIFSNCLRASKLPPTNLTLKTREREREREQRSQRQSRQIFSACDKCSPHSNGLCSCFASANSKHFWESCKPHLCSLHLHKPLYECRSCHRMIDPSITLLLNAISGQWERMSLLMVAFVNPRNLITWIYWRKKGQFGKHL